MLSSCKYILQHKQSVKKKKKFIQCTTNKNFCITWQHQQVHSDVALLVKTSAPKPELGMESLVLLKNFFQNRDQIVTKLEVVYELKIEPFHAH